MLCHILQALRVTSSLHITVFTKVWKSFTNLPWLTCSCAKRDSYQIQSSTVNSHGREWKRLGLLFRESQRWHSPWMLTPHSIVFTNTSCGGGLSLSPSPSVSAGSRLLGQVILHVRHLHVLSFFVVCTELQHQRPYMWLNLLFADFLHHLRHPAIKQSCFTLSFCHKSHSFS